MLRGGCGQKEGKEREKERHEGKERKKRQKENKKEMGAAIFGD